MAPYWDDVDIRFDTGDISYEIHESGFVLDQVNAFIRKKRPTDFEGTWMMVAFYDAVHPYFGLFNSQVCGYNLLTIIIICQMNITGEYIPSYIDH